MARDVLSYEDAATFVEQLADKTEMCGRFNLDGRRLQCLRLIAERVGVARPSAWKLGIRGPYAPRFQSDLEILEEAGAILYEPKLHTTSQLRRYVMPHARPLDPLRQWLDRGPRFLDLAATVLHIQATHHRRGIHATNKLVATVARYGGRRWTVCSVVRVVKLLAARGLFLN